MGKYAKTLTEYIQDGGTLPTSLNEIEGFSRLFTLHFADYEIAFEGQAFYNKVQEKCVLFMDEYKTKIALKATYYTKAENPVRVHYDTTNTVLVVGDQRTDITELPIDYQSAQPTSVTKSDEYTNSDTRTTEARDEGDTTTEVLAMLEALNADVTPLLEKLLNKFESCFLGVY